MFFLLSIVIVDISHKVKKMTSVIFSTRPVNFTSFGGLSGWVPLGTDNRGNFKSWVPLGTGNRGNFRSWVPLGTGYRPEKNFRLLVGIGYRPDKNFGYRWVPGTGQIKNFEYRWVQISNHDDPCCWSYWDLNDYYPDKWKVYIVCFIMKKDRKEESLD